MKLYGYAISIPCSNKSCVTSFTREVRANSGMAGRVQKNVPGTDFKYLVYLREDDKTKAISLIKETIQKEIDDFYRQINLRNEFLRVACGPVGEIEEI